MSFREFVAGELIDIIEWIDESDDTMVSRFSRPNNEIKNGAQLIVRPGQVALFVDQGEIADVFVSGRHELATGNLPLLSRLRGWKYGFESPFKAEVIFVSTKQFTNRKWGTSNPVIVRDPALGPVRLRAFGTYAIRVQDSPKFVREIVGTNSLFLIDQITEQLRDLVVARVSGSLTDDGGSVLDLATKYSEIGDRVLGHVAPQFQQYGLELTQLVIENVSLPAEVEAALDQRSKMNILGDMDQYSKLQSADAMRDAAKNPGGIAAAGVGLGLGAAMANRVMAPGMAAPAAPAPAAAANDGPPPVPVDAWYYVVGGERRGPVELGALKREVAGGVVTPESLVWKRGMSAWTRLAEVAELR